MPDKIVIFIEERKMSSVHPTWSDLETILSLIFEAANQDSEPNELEPFNENN